MKLRSAVLILAIAAAISLLSGKFLTANLEPSLAGKVAIVTGGSRGIGKGIAIGLGEAGATVYVTGRTLGKESRNTGGINFTAQSGTLEETCQAVGKAGGKCIPLAVDSGNDDQIKELFDQVIREQGRVDILINNAFSAVSWLPRTMGQPFWEKGVESWDAVNHVGLRSHYVASVHAAQHMSKAKSGLIVNVGSLGGLSYIFDVSYGIGKAAMDRMANDMAVELATENVTMVSLWPGLVKTENVQDGALAGGSERRGVAPGSPAFDFEPLLQSPLAETPLFVGRTVAAFARDRRKMDVTGKVLLPAIMAAGYGIVDERGVRSPPMISMKFGIAYLLRSFLQNLQLWRVPDELWVQHPPPSASLRFLWNTLPDLCLPSAVAKLAADSPNL
ncbi:unnamed protein product [Effrenium voratum]|uniref:Uncharacterized protein n=1 Tax=Effrenium voratum TaxID=2562239 RepID=A0AA36MRD1_9DINO|nr:unnamed protein product [Effrenium voratum]CAJ1435479.1 unnamed protein product [Effrenium voratum]